MARPVRFPQIFGEPLSGFERWLIAILAGVGTIFIAGAVTVHPSLFPDPAYGLLVNKSMAAGAPWNHMVEPSPVDIATDRSQFYAIWAPGQYMVPAAFTKLGLALGDALRLLGILCSVAALIGWFQLFRILGYERCVALAACAVIAASRTFALSFLTYSGSDLLAFCFFPYLAMAVFALRGSDFMAVVTPALVVAAFFLKNSLAIQIGAWIVAVSGVAALYRFESIRRGVLLFGVTIASLLAAFWFLEWSYVSRGWTPVAYQPVWTSDVRAYVLPWSMPLLAATGWDDVLSRVFHQPGRISFDYKRSLLLMLLVVFGSITAVTSGLRHQVRQEGAREIVVFVGMIVLVFTVLLATGSAASLDLSRHYIVAGTMLLPLLISRIVHLKGSMTRPALLVLLLIVPATYGVTSFAANWKRHFDRRASHSKEVGITHLMLTPRLVQYLRALDRDLPGGTTLAVMPAPSFALEFSRTRVLSTSATADGMLEIRRTVRHGTVNNLLVVAERDGQTPDEIAAWLASFASYHPDRWDVLEVDGFLFYVPLDQPVDRVWLEAELQRL